MHFTVLEFESVVKMVYISHIAINKAITYCIECVCQSIGEDQWKKGNGVS